MKKLLLMLMLVLGASMSQIQPVTATISYNSEYCEGWADGYCEGWRNERGQYSICPVTPICPIAEIGKDRYRDGYNRGFRRGSADARKK